MGHRGDAWIMDEVLSVFDWYENKKFNTHIEYLEYKAWKRCRSMSVSDLLPMLRAGKRILRFAAALQLQVRGDASVVAHCEELCGDADYKARQMGAHVLGQIRLEEPARELEIMQLLKRLAGKDVHSRVRQAAVFSLGKRYMGGFADTGLVIPALRSSVGDPDPLVRLAVAQAVGNINDARIVPVTEVLLRDPDAEVRNWAAFAVHMQRLDSVEIRNGLVAMLDESELEDGRHEAITALAQLGDYRVIEALKRELDPEQDQLYDAMVEAAGMLGDPVLVPLLEELRKRYEGSEELIDQTLEGLKVPYH